MAHKKTPGYEVFRIAFGSAMASWRAHAKMGQVKQQFFFGTTLTRVIGALVVASCRGLFITIMNLNIGMPALPALAIATSAVFVWLFSRKE
jgi:hypothetical protein